MLSKHDFIHSPEAGKQPYYQQLTCTIINEATHSRFPRLVFT